MIEVRTRFAPSPTGWLHVGGTRTALFAWIMAKQASGKFILRIEDTDKAREVQDAARHIMESLRWLGLGWNEGPDIGGKYGPYKQSERLKIYREWALKLVNDGRAYPDPYSQKEVEAFRERAKASKKAFLYRDFRPEKVQGWDGKQPLRFKSEPKEYTWYDLVMGELHGGPELIDDFVILKSDGYPTYNFAHVIDDHLMNVSHVIRSQEFLSSVPRYLNLYEALSIHPPLMATLPPVLEPDGRKKLSKRTGAKDILDYAREGYLPEALFNFMATLGWNDGTTQEIYSKQEIVKKFDIKRVQKSGAKFDEQRLNWMNGYYIRSLRIDELMKLVEKYWPTEAISFSEAYKSSVLQLVQDRLKFFSELAELTIFFFTEPSVNLSLIDNNKFLKTLSHKELCELLKTVQKDLQKSDFSQKDLTARLNNLLVITRQKPAILFSLVRVVTTWAPASPGLAESLNVLGKAVSLKRIDEAIKTLSSK